RHLPRRSERALGGAPRLLDRAQAPRRRGIARPSRQRARHRSADRPVRAHRAHSRRHLRRERRGSVVTLLGTMIRREYLQRVRRRSFLISTLLAPIGLLAAFLVPVFLATHGGGTRRVVVLDQSGEDGLFGAIEREVAHE